MPIPTGPSDPRGVPPMMRAEIIAKALGGRKVGAGWLARCPVHDDRTPSLSIHDAGGKVLVRCHAGCAQHDVIGELRARGLWGQQPRSRWRSQHRGVDQEDRPELSDNKRRGFALSLWDAAGPPEGTPVETYLAARGLLLPPTPALRCHRGLRQPSGSIWPCMVALVTRGDDGKPLAVHRTFLARDGSAKAPVKPAKMMLGPCRGGAVRLAEASELLTVGEGVETCLAAMQATGHPAWAAVSTSGLRALRLPACIREVIVLADGDDAGEAAARECARRWTLQGRRVRIARPPPGQDFNDMLLGHGACTEGGAT